MKPEYSITDSGLRIANVTADCPVIYDNDFWVDAPVAAYVWAKASLGECKLRGNIVTRCTFGWQERYAHELDQQVGEAERLLKLANDSGLRNIPKLTIGSTVAHQPPASGKIEDTQCERSAGSELIVQEARKASPERPLLVFVGGSCTTVASACLSDSSIANRPPATAEKSSHRRPSKSHCRFLRCPLLNGLSWNIANSVKHVARPSGRFIVSMFLVARLPSGSVCIAALCGDS